jgi:hypothetical protein
MSDIGANVELSQQETDSINYILIYTRDCNYTNKMLRHAHSDIEFICYDGKIDNNIFAPLTAVTNFTNQVTGKVTKISLNKIRQLPNYTYDRDEGFQKTNKLCDSYVCLINRNDMTGGILRWVNPQPKISAIDVKNHFQEITKEYASLNKDNGSAHNGWGMNDTSGGKRTKKRPKRKRKSTKRRRGTRKRTNKKR